MSEPIQTSDKHEEAFEQWKKLNEEVLMVEYPCTVGHHGAANNYSYWCRQVYTGRIKINCKLANV